MRSGFAGRTDQAGSYRNGLASRKLLQFPSMHRIGEFVADDVDLGKTIEAGLILREILLCQRIRRVEISFPPLVRRQRQAVLEPLEVCLCF